MNLANKLTLSRILAAPLLLALLARPNFYANSLALAVFLLAVFTDFYDGWIARSRGEVSSWGALLDPLADKILISTVLISLVGLGAVPAWMVVLIVGRELAVSGLRTWKMKEGIILPSSRLGKYKTFFQDLAIISALILVITKNSLLPRRISYLLLLTATALTIFSGIEYFLKVNKPGRKSARRD